MSTKQQIKMMGLIVIMIVFFIYLNSCGKQDNEKEFINKKTEKQYGEGSTITKDECESILAERNVPLYENSKLYKIDYRKDLIAVHYFVMDEPEKSHKNVGAFYDSIIKKNFSKKKYKIIIDGDTMFFVKKENKGLFCIINGTGVGTDNLITILLFK